ncbi:MAG: hypothetical protein F6K19_01555 [Cyanothece sp. SIO1E1]|nr:hypothetical protein [Cyanothece sp. SIO1E1]
MRITIDTDKKQILLHTTDDYTVKKVDSKYPWTEIDFQKENRDFEIGDRVVAKVFDEVKVCTINKGILNGTYELSVPDLDFPFYIHPENILHKLYPGQEFINGMVVETFKEDKS